MIRGIVKSVVQGVIQRVSATVWGNGAIDDRELFQHYGYSSRPLAGSEVIFIRQGNHFIAIASDDRRYRIALEEGECAIYDDLGQKVHLTRDGIVAASSKRINATAPLVEIVATAKVTVTTPLLEVSGDIKAGGGVSDRKGSIQAMRDTHNAHLHPDPQGGSTAKTPQVM
jgi:phage gp45-like